MKLREVMEIMRQIDGEILNGRKSMMNMGSLGVDSVRHQINSLEDIRETLFNEKIVSNRSLDNLLTKYRDCVRECVEPFYKRKYPPLADPVPEKWVEELPVTVTAVHLIIYLDISDSMFDWGGFRAGGIKRTLVQNFVNKIKKRLDEERDNGTDIPFKVSLVGYADPTDRAGHNRKDGSAQRFWQIVMNKSSDVTALANNIGSINKSQWVNGLSQIEEGLSCAYYTIDQLYDGTVVNGKKTENIVLIISDERQRASNITGSHRNYKRTVSTTQFRNKMSGKGIKNIFALMPFSVGYNYNGYNVNTSKPTKAVNWNSGIRGLFRSTKEYWSTTQLSQMDNWIRWILNPDSFGK